MFSMDSIAADAAERLNNYRGLKATAKGIGPLRGQ
jgi:hypothetical protein